MNISMGRCIKALKNTRLNFGKINPDKYVKISPEINAVSADAFKYINGLKSDIAVFAKKNKIKIEIAPRPNYNEIIEKYNMSIFDTKVENIKKVKPKPFGLGYYIDTNSEKNVFILHPPFEKTHKPFGDELLTSFEKVIASLKRKNDF